MKKILCAIALVCANFLYASEESFAAARQRLKSMLPIDALAARGLSVESLGLRELNDEERIVIQYVSANYFMGPFPCDRVLVAEPKKAVVGLSAVTYHYMADVTRFSSRLFRQQLSKMDVSDIGFCLAHARVHRDFAEIYPVDSKKVNEAIAKEIGCVACVVEDRDIQLRRVGGDARRLDELPAYQDPDLFKKLIADLAKNKERSVCKACFNIA